MSAITHHLVSRSVQAANHHFRNKDSPSFELDVPTWGLVMLGFTTFLFFVTWLIIRYTYGEVVATLAMIETPVATAIIRTSELESEDPDAPLLSPEEKATDGLVQQELLLVKSKPITSSLRATVRHLRARAGCASLFRGAQVLALYAFLFHLFSTMFSSNRPRPLTDALVHIGVTILLCRVNMAWTHTMISEPTGKSAFSRIVGGYTARKIVGPTAVYAVIEQIAILAPTALFRTFGLHRHANNPVFFRSLPVQARRAISLQFVAVGLVGLFVCVFVLFPAHVVLRRVQASLLPDKDESIVPFDRSFGGKVVPEIVGGTGRVGMCDAWKTFDWNARVRLVKVYAKMVGMEMVLAFTFMTIFILQAKLVLGPQLDKHIAMAKADFE